MQKNKLAVIILAAGKGKRMNNPNLPKVLAEIDSKPLIYYVLKQVDILTPDKVVLVVGNLKELVIDYIEQSEFDKIDFAIQEQQLGTGHAVEMSREILHDFNGDVLILAGDVPLLTAESLRKFINLHYSCNSDVSVLSTIAPNPDGYGRIVRDSNDNFLRITEHKDADDTVKKIDEINSGIYLVKKDLLFESLQKVKNNNSQGEYYLTDIIEILKDEGKNVHSINAAPFEELQGINTTNELERAEEMYRLIRKS